VAETGKKLDEVSELIGRFSELANRLAHQFKVGSEPYETEGGVFRISRYKGAWEIVWSSSEGEWDIRAASVAVRRKFLTVAEPFFKKYLETAKTWERTIDQDIEKGREALDEITKLIA
jgi:hypothetical protein